MNFIQKITLMTMTLMCCNINGQAANSHGDGTRRTAAQTAGIGIYPGAPAERFAPGTAAATGTARRTLSLRRAVRTSSCFDYNLTGQLLTSGISSKAMPATLVVTSRQGLLPRREREWAIDGGDFTRNIITGSDNFLQYEWTGMTLHADRIEVVASVAYREKLADNGYDIRLLTRQADGTWRTLCTEHGDTLPGQAMPYRMQSDPNKQTANDFLPARRLRASFALPEGQHDLGTLRVEFSMKGAAYWTVFNINMYDGKHRLTTEMLPLSHFTCAWLSDDKPSQWVEVDLGAAATVDGVHMEWIKKADGGHIETSLDGKQWARAASLPGGKRLADNIAISPTNARYVRLVLTRPAHTPGRNDPLPYSAYAMRSLNIMGHGGIVATPAHEGGMDGQRYMLNGGEWRVQRASEIDQDGARISTPSYSKKASAWMLATVPGTVLTSYVNTGAVPDPNHADNLFNISDSYFYSDFWYRRAFRVPAAMRGRHVTLNLDGINWKADVWLNGRRIDRIEGAFCRGKVDITPFIIDGDNILAVRIIRNDHPGAVKEKNRLNTDFNGGILGADNPTFHASTGWDWISTVRGRNTGIWNDVYLTATDCVTLADPVLTTQLDLPRDTTATLTPRVVVTNVLSHDVSGTLQAWIGNIKVQQSITLKGGQRREVVFSPEQYPELRGQRMRLWWPNGYGQPYLYDAGFEFTPDATTATTATDGGAMQPARITYRAGIRQMTYATPKTQLQLFVNGRRFIPLGGNWGFPEVNLNYRAREYDTAVRLHRDMNFNMIRNWVGMTGDEEFYDACDRYGIMVWQDFWLANPVDGANPDDEDMFMRNARDFTQRMRSHASIALYCGRNEGYPPKTLDNMLRQTVDEMNPGLIYISSSADEGVSGHGPYWAEPPRTYFRQQTGKLHTERGMPNIMTIDGLERTIDATQLWPVGDAWGQHDFTQHGAQRGASFGGIVERMFGKQTSAADFAANAQWENYEGYRAMFEADSRYRQGLLIWMSHSCWPSLTWQCYDYYFEPTAAFFACRKACEPLHIQRNALTKVIEVVNRSAPAQTRITATREVMDINGRTIDTDSATFDIPTDTTVTLSQIAADTTVNAGSGVYYVRLTLRDTGKRVLSSNFYVLSTDDGNLQQLLTLPETKVTASTNRTTDTSLTLTLRNASATPAMMLRLNLKADDGQQVLPVSYSDNYFHLMPGEERTVTVGWNSADARLQAPFVELTGFNVKKRVLR